MSVISQSDVRAGRVAAIYARVSWERQRQDETIQSQTAGLRKLAAERGLLIQEDLVFEDEGFSGATLIRPALERLRDRAAEGCFEVLLCHAPDRLARRYAYQVLLLEELARAGVEVIFARGGEQSGSPEDQLLRQFQGMIAEYERAQIRERTRRGKLHRARTGHQAVMAGAHTATGSSRRPTSPTATGRSTRPKQASCAKSSAATPRTAARSASSPGG
jgi:site-specific DNA recombinase